ncbi:hypothetical protein MMC07_006139 [Pseudocyphellaria aurata]|nr:hypothetical protein [Pseudocyphellaria aurata]
MKEKAMTAVTLSNLPSEIQANIAHNCDKNDLISLCLVSKRVNETCLPLLYRHVDLKAPHMGHGLEGNFKRQRQLVRTLLSRPGYGRHIRVLKVSLFTPDYGKYPSLRQDRILDTRLWDAMQSLTHVRSVDISAGTLDFRELSRPTLQILSDLFPSVTSVTLVGRMDYRLAKLILNSINPATLKHLCLNLVRDSNLEYFFPGFMLGDRGKDGQLLAHGATAGLLTSTTGRYTTLQTLILQRLGQAKRSDWQFHDAAENASYTEWAAFICSVQPTIEKFRFEQVDQYSLTSRNITDRALSIRVMDERFERLILPTIVSGSWPHLTLMELRGVRGFAGQGGTAGLTANLRALHGRNTCIVVEETTRYFNSSEPWQ